MSALDHGMGWRRELPDFRDITFDSHEVQMILRISNSYKAVSQPNAVLPASVELRKWCTRVRDQGRLNSAPAFAVTALMEYFDRRAFGRHADYSEAFLYRSTRDLSGYAGDLGADVRTTLRALKTFGLPAENLFPYDPCTDSGTPPAFCYGFADSFRTLKYFRLDDPDLTGKEVLLNVRKCLAARMPSVFGLSVYSSFPVAGEGNEVCAPQPGEQLMGGHSMLAVGYDDERMIGPDQGALLVRNSWGPSWGDKGYAWLSYKYLEDRLAVDFWSLIRPDFINTDLFN
ncbi:MAG: cysteine protease [Polyangiaceae bacterium]|nr:cysteine protease [Polyangiaceae bacterium]MBK8939629.1 cysteine protease [Polyangiaceae bacterium]